MVTNPKQMSQDECVAVPSERSESPLKPGNGFTETQYIPAILWNSIQAFGLTVFQLFEDLQYPQIPLKGDNW